MFYYLYSEQNELYAERRIIIVWYTTPSDEDVRGILTGEGINDFSAVEDSGKGLVDFLLRSELYSRIADCDFGMDTGEFGVKL